MKTKPCSAIASFDLFENPIELKLMEPTKNTERTYGNPD